MPMTSVARALEVDETRGFMKAIVDADSGQILGAAVLGVEGGEVMSISTGKFSDAFRSRTGRSTRLSHPTARQKHASILII